MFGNVWQCDVTLGSGCAWDRAVAQKGKEKQIDSLHRPRIRYILRCDRSYSVICSCWIYSQGMLVINLFPFTDGFSKAAASRIHSVLTFVSSV